jgi:hypothetical protein
MLAAIHPTYAFDTARSVARQNSVRYRYTQFKVSTASTVPFDHLILVT